MASKSWLKRHDPKTLSLTFGTKSWEDLDKLYTPMLSLRCQPLTAKAVSLSLPDPTGNG